MRIVSEAPAVAPLVRFETTVAAASEEEARARLWANAAELIGTTFVAALIQASHDDPFVLKRVAELRGRELWVTVDRARHLRGRTHFGLTVYPGGERDALTQLSAG